MGKAQSKNIGFSNLGFASASTKRRENPEGGYVLSGCINNQFQESEESLWHSKVALLGTSDSSEKRRSFQLSPIPQTSDDPHLCQCNTSHVPVGFANDNCHFEVALPPEVTGSAYSLKVVAVEKTDSINNGKPPLSTTMSSNSGKATVGAVDCDISLDGKSDQQEWAFTLYDFDGHRKVTREDLSSLLKTISEALASTITLPASGSKKLRLRLSVGSEDSGDPKPFTAENKENVARSTVPVSTGPGKPLHEVDGLPTPAGYQQPVRNGVPVRTNRHNRRTMSASQADSNGVEGRSPNTKRQHKLRRHQSSYNHEGGVEVRQRPHVVSSSSSLTKEPENRERRNYYEELAGIENNSNQQEEAIVLAKEREVEYLAQKQLPRPHRTRHTSAERLRGRGHRQSSKGGKGGHRRSRSYDLDAQQPIQEGVLSTEEHKLKCGLRQRYHKDYHMLLLEASRAKLEGFQPASPPSPTGNNQTSQVPLKLPTFNTAPSPLARLATFAPPAPSPTNLCPTQLNSSPALRDPALRDPALRDPALRDPALRDPALRDPALRDPALRDPALRDPALMASPKVPTRRRSHKKLRKPALQPFTYMQHEIANGIEGVVYVPVSQQHEHHHHHDHHHHHHYHHYHK